MTVLFKDDFANGKINPEWNSDEMAFDHSAQIVSSPARLTNGRALKVTFKRTDHGDFGNKRAELHLGTVEMGSDLWYGMSMYIPNSFTTTEGGYILQQWHDFPDFDLGEDWKIPTLFLGTEGRTIGLGNRWDENRFTENIREVPGENWDLGPVVRNRWVDYLYHIKWSPEDDGFIELFMNGRSVVKKEGPSTYNDEKGPYFKIGIYASGFEDDSTEYDFTEQVVYYANVVVATTRAEAEIKAVTPPPVPPTPPTGPTSPTALKPLVIKAPVSQTAAKPFSLDVDAGIPAAQVSKVELWIDGKIVGTQKEIPYLFIPSEVNLNLAAGSHFMEARVFNLAQKVVSVDGFSLVVK